MKRFGPALLSLMAIACATIGNGPMQRVRIDSPVPNTVVRLENCGLMASKSAVAPATVWVSRRATQCRLFVSVPGEPAESFRLSRHLSHTMKLYGATLGVLASDDNWQGDSDLFEIELAAAAMMLPSFAVDFATGSMFEQRPSRIVAEHRP